MSTISDFGIPGIGAGISHPKQRNKWRAKFIGMGGTIDSQPVSMQCVRVERPKLDWDEVVLHRYTTQAYVLGKYQFSELQIEVEDDIKGTAATVIQEQLQRQQWIIGAEGQFFATGPEGSVYKFGIVLEQLDGATSNPTVLEQWFIEGAMIKGAAWDENDYSNSEQMKITLTIRYDNAKQVIGNYNNPGSALGGPANQ